jgi:hypothetical protein
VHRGRHGPALFRHYPPLRLLPRGYSAAGSSSSHVCWATSPRRVARARLGPHGPHGTVVAGRLYLAAHAVGLRAIGSTSLDDEVVEFFSPHAVGSGYLFRPCLRRPPQARPPTAVTAIGEPTLIGGTQVVINLARAVTARTWNCDRGEKCARIRLARSILCCPSNANTPRIDFASATFDKLVARYQQQDGTA